MSVFQKAIWKLRSDAKKIEILRKQGLQIGAECEVLNGFDFGSEPYLVEIGNHVRISPGVRITTHDGGMWVLRGLYPELKNVDLLRRVKIGDNCHIGMNSMIMPGVTIGNNCIVGAGAIVTKDVPDNSIVVGVPARIIEHIEEYKDKNLSEMVHTKGLSPEEKRAFVEAHSI